MIPPRWFLASMPVLLAATASVAIAAGAAHRVEQRGRQFSVSQVAIAVGDTVQFVNADPFLHQIYVYSRGFTFDSDEQAPGNTIDVTFPAAGTFEVRCHIHPIMRLIVNVK